MAAHNIYWRVAHFLAPFYSMIPTNVLGVQILVRAWVPVDDTHSMFWNFSGPNPFRSVTGTKKGKAPGGATVNNDFIPNSSDFLGRWRLAANEGNDYQIDREAQKNNKIYTGITGIHLQDQAVTESMGKISDRTREHLGASDSMVIKTRQSIMRAARNLQEGIIPPTVDRPELYQERSGGVILPKDAKWYEATKELRKAFVDRPELVGTDKGKKA